MSSIDETRLALILFGYACLENGAIDGLHV